METLALQAKTDQSDTESIWKISPISVELVEVEFWRESKPNPIQGDKMKANVTPDFIPDLPLNDKIDKILLNSLEDGPKRGIPCDHPGYASHLSHPCEGCGRYAAGAQSGPDVHHAKRYIEKLARTDTVIHSFLMLKQQNKWTWEQTLLTMVIKQAEINENLEAKLNDAILNRAKQKKRR